MHERFDARPTYGARVILHPYNLTATLAQAKMSTRQYYSVFDDSEANDTFALGFIRLGSGAGIFFAIHVCELENCPIVEQLLLQKLESKRMVTFHGERSQ